MADRNYEVEKQFQAQEVTDLKKAIMLKADVQKDDTVTVSQLTSIDYVKVVNASTGVEVACTEATNVITITEDPLAADIQVIIFVVGT